MTYELFKGIMLGVFLFSFLQAIFLLYKDKSIYFEVRNIDIVFGGPICWLLVLIFAVLDILIKILKIKPKKKPYKPISNTKIRKTVKKIIKIYKQNRKLGRCRHNYFDISRHVVWGSDYESEYSGWEKLMVKQPQYESINKRFIAIMRNQMDDVLPILKEFMKPLTPEFMEIDGCDKYFVHEFICRIEKMDGESTYYYIP